MVLAGVSVLAFSLIHMVEGDPIRQALGTRFSQEAYDALEKRNGLELPVVRQYFRWLGHALPAADRADRRRPLAGRRSQ